MPRRKATPRKRRDKPTEKPATTPAGSNLRPQGPAARPRGPPAKAQPRQRGAPKEATRQPMKGDELRDAQRLRKVEQELKRLEKERATLIPKVAAISPPESPFPDAGITRRRGSVYKTWFKAQGSFGERQDWDAYAQMQGLLDDTELDLDVPTAFYSNHVTGRVMYPGIVDREAVIADLNDKAPWNGDFRDIYPRWWYEYRVAEFIGGVVVRFWIHKARQPRTARDRRNGYNAY